MTHADFHTELSKLLYIEDFGMYDIILASIVANSQKLGDPVWLSLVGPSSGGKSQIIRPFAKSRPEFIHRLDDLTANTLMSGSIGAQDSLLGRIGAHGVLCMDDLTVLNSKGPEERAAVLSQFRMIYDGRFAKSSGNKKEDLVWEGYLGMIAGSTPAIYRIFNDVADMGERFVIYRMKPFDKKKALAHILANPLSSRDLDDALSQLLKEHIGSILADVNPDLLVLEPEIEQKIAEFSDACALLRTPVHIDQFRQMVDEFPEPEMPLRVMKQLLPMAKSLQVVRGEKLSEASLKPLLWVAYSLSNDKRRAFLRTIVGLDYYSKEISDKSISAVVGLNAEIVKAGMSQLMALGIVGLKDENVGNNDYELKNLDLKKIINHLDPPPASIEEVRDVW